MVRYWTMRYEAKHSYFKQLTLAMGNYINLPLSLARRHQQMQCYLNLSKGVKDELVIGPSDKHVLEMSTY